MDSCLRRNDREEGGNDNEIASPAFAEPALMKMGGQAYFVPRNDTRAFIYKGFRPPSGMP
jgi:hypothetical protein